MLAVVAIVAAALGVGIWQVSAGASAAPGPSGVAIPQSAPSGWKIVYEDWFGGNSLGSIWQAYSGQPGKDSGGWWDPSHDVVSGDELQLQAYADPAHCPRAAGCESYDREVTGGVKLGIARTYGRYLVRLRAGNAQGVSIVALLWPADNLGPPEIDFAEDNGATPRTLDTVTFHYGDPEQAIRYTLPVNMSQWHTYGVQWTPGRIAYTIDGHTWATIHNAAVPSQPMNLAIQDQTWDCGLSWEQCARTGPAPAANLDIAWVVVEAPTSNTDATPRA
jgi:beta-glucanase (GH16 family)